MWSCDLISSSSQVICEGTAIATVGQPRLCSTTARNSYSSSASYMQAREAVFWQAARAPVRSPALFTNAGTMESTLRSLCNRCRDHISFCFLFLSPLRLSHQIETKCAILAKERKKVWDAGSFCFCGAQPTGSATALIQESVHLLLIQVGRTKQKCPVLPAATQWRPILMRQSLVFRPYLAITPTSLLLLLVAAAACCCCLLLPADAAFPLGRRNVSCQAAGGCGTQCAACKLHTCAQPSERGEADVQQPR